MEGAVNEKEKLMNKLYKESAEVKGPAVVEYMLELLESDASAKFLFFAHHQCLLDAMEQVRRVDRTHA